MNFLSGKKTRLDKKDKVDFKISHKKKAMKFGQVIEYSKINTFSSKNHEENEAGRLVPDIFLFKKTLYEVKASDLHLSFNMFW